MKMQKTERSDRDRTGRQKKTRALRHGQNLTTETKHEDRFSSVN